VALEAVEEKGKLDALARADAAGIGSVGARNREGRKCSPGMSPRSGHRHRKQKKKIRKAKKMRRRRNEE
jgi:hypothetical protein